MPSHETLGLLLVRDGLIARPQLYDALRLQRQNHRLLGTCLLRLGYVTATQLLEILARQLAIPALPPGSLGNAAPEAIARVPGELAVRLRVLPYSWSGDMLGVAVTDGRALNHLHEVAFESQSAVGAYVALETEIEEVLRQCYPNAAAALHAPEQHAASDGYLRPARAELPTRDFGPALGLEDNPVELGKPKPAPEVIRSLPPPAPSEGPPAAATPAAELTRAPFYDAVEQIYEASDSNQVGQCTGEALLNYFTRVLVLLVRDGRLEVAGQAGMRGLAANVELDRLHSVASRLATRSIAYGPAAADPRAAELAQCFGFPPAPTSLIAPVADLLLVYADNGDAAELYEDLHDVELLFKEAETALGLLA